jgi:hypothetical protein
MNDDNRSTGKDGRQAIVGAVIAIVGVLAAANPRSMVLRALNDSAPQLATAIPTIISACGAIIAALSPPPRLSRGVEER